MKKLIKARSRTGLALSTGLLALGSSSLASAQVLQEIVVSAQKREQSASDVGISVTAYSGEQLRELGYVNTTDLAAQTPGLSIFQFHPSVTNVNIRGISQNDFGDHLEPPVAMFVDEAYGAPMGAVHAQMFDIQRVEVLRGPQGTLFGRNATGGLIHYISNKPTNSFEAYADLTLGDFSQVMFEGALSGPLSDRVLGRLSVATNKHDGTYENRIGEDLRADDSKSARGQLLFNISDSVELLGKIHYSTTDTVGNGYSHEAAYQSPEDDFLAQYVRPDELHVWQTLDGVSPPFTSCAGCDAFGYREPDDNPWTGSVDDVGFFDREIYGATARLTWRISDDVTLTSISDYLSLDKDYREDSEASPIFQFNYETHQDFEQYSEEVRLAGKVDKLQWVGGLYYLNIDTSQIALGEENLGPFFGIPVGTDVAYIPVGDWTTTTQSWAAFGQMEYAFTSHWSGILGLRYTKDEKEQDFRWSDNFGDSFDFSTRTFPDYAQRDFENVSAKLELDWRPTDDWLVYASLNRGHKGGNWAAPIFLPPAGPARVAFAENNLPHDEEVLHSFELGFKADFGMTRVNAGIFVYDYDDYQASSFRNNIQSIANVDAEAIGAELEVITNPATGWEFLLGASVMDSKVKDVQLPSGRIVDRELPLTPRVALNGLGRYQWPVLGGLMSAQVDFNYKSDFCFSVLCAPTDEEDAYIVSNARVGWSSANERLSLAIFVKNFTEEEYRLFSLDVSSIGYLNSSYGPPRWWGASIGYRW